MGNAIGTEKTLKEQLRDNKRMINRSIREIDRERTALQQQEKKLIIDIKKMAKEGQTASVNIMAKDLVRTRNYISKFYTMRSQLQGVQLRIQTAKSQEAMTGAMKNTGAIMKSMAQQMNMPKLNKIMMEFAKENEKMEMTQEMIGDTMDDVMEPDQDEEEEERIVSQVLDEIGIDMAGAIAEAPSAAAPAQAQAAPEQKAPAPALVGAGAATAAPAAPPAPSLVPPLAPAVEADPWSDGGTDAIPSAAPGWSGWNSEGEPKKTQRRTWDEIRAQAAAANQ